MFRLIDFVYDNCLFRQFKVNELLFVEYRCVADELKLKVWSHHNYFIYILGGKKVWQTLRSRYVATSGQALFVKKGANIVHQFFDKDFCALIIFIPDEFIIETIHHSEALPAASKTEANSDSVIPLPSDPVLTAYVQSVLAYFGQEKEPPVPLLELKFRELIVNLVSSGQHRELAAYLLSLCEKNKSCIKEVMEKNFIYNMSLGEFARLTGRSLATFKRDFMATFATPPGRWLLQRKLEYARHLLQVSDKNVNELSYDAGFQSSSHFIRAFRNAYKTTPLQYKKSLIRNNPG